MVELYLNNQKVDLRGNETIATDYSIAPIGNIASRGSAKSVTFKLPLTANNRAIIENANVIVNETVLPYRLIPAKLYANGLTQQIEFAQIKSIKDDISITLFGSNVDFFGIIKSLKLADLGVSLIHAWTLASAYASRANANGYIYAMIDYHSDSPNAYIDDTTAQIDVRGLLPSVFLHSVIDLIITQAGFTAEGEILSDPNYLSVLLPCVGTEVGNVKQLMESTASISSPQSPPPSTSQQIAFDTPIYNPLGLIQNVPGKGDIYKSYLTGVYSVRLTVTYTNSDALGVVFRAGKYIAPGYAAFNLDTQGFTDIGTFTRVIDFVDLDLAIDDYLFLSIAGNSYTLNSALLEVTDANIPDGTIFGKQFDPLSNIGDMKQSDLLKDAAQKFGLILQVDNARKIVHIRKFSEIIANIPNALDWSDKVDYSEKPEIEFDSDYAQRNLCEYKEDDTVKKPTGTDSEILIDNDNLDAEKKLFESPFAASEQVLRFNGISIAQIKMFTDLGGADEEIEEVEPRYLILRRQTFSPAFTWTDGTNTDTDFEVPLTHFILSGEEFNAGFDNNLLDNSRDLIALIQQFKTVKMLMRITAADINQLDFFTPVWIELKGQTGCYFYISEIKQFKVTSKESTDVELVKLSI